jgi:hypothetical protein
MRRSLLLLSTALVALAVVPAAAANRPMREVIPAPPDQIITDQCAFPVLGHIDGVEIQITFTDHAGNVVKQISVFPGNTLTLTNLDTGTSITVGSAGATHARLQRDGSVSVGINGHGPLPNDVAGGAPGLWYLDGGRVHAIFDAEGNLTSIDSTGHVINLCDQLG